jgi:broad specificity phosphatase PhoE
MKIHFVRHGESEANLLREFSNRGVKHGLTKTGRAQAAQLATKLDGLPVGRIYSSPLLRAVQTADIIAEKLHAPRAVVEALREYDCGALEGRSDAASWAEYEHVLREWMVHHRWESRIEDGESFLDIKQRFVPFIQRLKAEHGGSSTDLVVVGHGGLFRCMLPLVVENVDFDFAMQHPLDQGGHAVAEMRGKELVCTGWVGVANSLPRVTDASNAEGLPLT